MKLDIIPEKKRKLTVTIFAFVALFVAVGTGQIDGAQFIDGLKWAIMGFMGGNGIEHISKGGGGILGAVIGNMGGKKKA
jgi:hypothetical protein